MSDKKILDQLKKKPVLLVILSILAIFALLGSLELVAPTNVKPSVLAGLREKVEPAMELEEEGEEKSETTVNNYEECQQEDGVTSTSQDGQEICTFGEKSYTKEEVVSPEDKKDIKKDSDNEPSGTAEPVNSNETITYTNPSFPNLRIPYQDSWSLNEIDQRNQGTGLYVLEFTRGSELLRVEINSLLRAGAAINCFQGDDVNVLEQLRSVDNQLEGVSTGGNSFYQSTGIFKIKDPANNQNFNYLYSGLEEFSTQDKEYLASGDPFYQDCSDSSTYKFSPVLTKVEGTEMSFVADLDFYLKTDNQGTVSEVDNLIKNSKL